MLHTVGSAAPGTAISDAGGGHTFVVDTPNLLVLDTATGIVLHRVALPTGTYPYASLYLDPAHRRLIALSQSDAPDGKTWATTIDSMTGALVHTQRLPIGCGGGYLDPVRSRFLTLCIPTQDLLGPHAPPTAAPAVAATLDISSGRLLRTAMIRPPTAPRWLFASAVYDSASGRLFVPWANDWHAWEPSQPAHVSTVDAVSGVLVGTVTLRGTVHNSTNLVLDSVHRHVAVVASLSSGATLVAMLDDTTGAVVATTTLSANTRTVEPTYSAFASPTQGRILVPDAGGLALLVQESDLAGEWLPPVLMFLDTHSFQLVREPFNDGAQIGDQQQLTADAVRHLLYEVDAGRLNHDDTNLQGDPGRVRVWDLLSGRRLFDAGLAPFPGTAEPIAGSPYTLLSDNDRLCILGPQAPLPSDPARRTAPGAAYFARIRHTLAGSFLAYWRRYGGVGTFGYPRTEPFVEDGHTVQYTDRFALALVNGTVQTLPVNDILVQRRAFPRAAPPTASGAGRYFADTGQTLSGRFLAYWRAHHGDILLGAPISEQFREGNDDGSGRRYLVQWFEKGRLEYHPELAGTRYEVEIGLVGLQALRQRGWLP